MAWQKGVPTTHRALGKILRPELDNGPVLGDQRLHDSDWEFVRKGETRFYAGNNPVVGNSFIFHKGKTVGKLLPAYSGWKFHINAPLTLEGARAAADDTLWILRDLGVWHKLPKNMRALEALYRKPDEVGKFITIYSANPQEAVDLIKALGRAPYMQGRRWSKADYTSYDRQGIGVIGGDVRVIGLENLYCRYGAYSGDYIPGPATGTKVRDNRKVGWPMWMMSFRQMADKNVTEYPPIGTEELDWKEAQQIARLNERTYGGEHKQFI